MFRLASHVMCALVALLAPLTAHAQELHIPVTRKVLDNGLTVLVWERPSAGRIGARIFYRVDIAAERPGTAGLTHMLEHHLFKGSDLAGTRDWEAEQAIAERVERIAREITDEENRAGDCFRQRSVFAEVENECETPRLQALRAELDEATAAQNRLAHATWYDWLVQSAGGTNSTASTGRDWMKFDIDLPANKLELFLWTERARLEHPVFRHFEPEREVVVDQIRRADNRPDGPFNRVLRSMTYDAHPYGWAHWFSDLTRATREDHWEIFYRYFIPQNTVIVVVGELAAETVVEKVEAYFGGWQPGRPSPRLRTVEPPPVGQKRLAVTAAAGPTLAIHVQMPAVGHADAPAFDVLAELLGGPQGLLRRELVDARGLATGAGAASWTSKYPSHFELRVDGRTNGDLEALEAAVDGILETIAGGQVAASDVSAAAGRLVLGLARRLDEIGSSAVTIGSMEAIHQWDHLNELPRLWTALTPADLGRIVRTYFKPEMRTVGVLRREERPVTTTAGLKAGAAAPPRFDRPAGEPVTPGFRRADPPSGHRSADELTRVRADAWPFGGPVGEWFFDREPAWARPPAAAARGRARVTGPPAERQPGERHSAVDAAQTAQPPGLDLPGPLAIAEGPWYAPPWMAGRRPAGFSAPAPARRYQDLRFEPTTFEPPEPAGHRLDIGSQAERRRGTPRGPALTAFVVEDDLLPVIQITVLIDAPETADPIGMEGLARLTADLLQRSDTAKRSRRELEAAFDRLEASVRVDADRNRTRVRAVAPGRSAGELVGLLAELVLQPDFATVFDAERERAALSAGRAADNAAFQVRALFDRALYGDQHPYGRRATPESVRAISLDHGLAFHADRYRPDRIVFAVSGRVQKEQVSAALDAALTAARPALPRPAPARAIIPPPQAPSQRLIVTREIDTRQGHVLLGHLGIQGLPADHAALELMHHILAGGGFVSRMMELLRTETGITAALYGEVEPGRDTVNPYLWRFSGRPETLARGIRLAIEQIELMREKGLTAEEFENARTAYLDGLIPASYETSHRTAERLAHKHLFGLYEYQSPQYLNYYAGDRAHIEALRRVTLEDVNRAARTYLHPDRLVIAVAGPLDEIRQGATESELPLVAPGRP